MQVTPNKEILPLTGLRFIAALYVLIFHIHIRWPVAQEPLLRNIFDQGAVGMSLFFMLSGFVLAYSYDGSKLPVKAYFVNRFARIYPIYVLAALVTLPWVGISLADGSTTSVIRSVAQWGTLIFANIFLIQAWLPGLFQYWNNGASWSISVEAFCYILLPLILPSLPRLSKRELYVLMAICLLLGSLPGITAAVFNNPVQTVYYSLPIYRVPEFVLGASLCLLRRSNSFSEKLPFTLLLALTVFFLYLGIWGSSMPFYIGHSWIALPCIALVIYTASTSTGFLARLLGNRLMVWLGKISYCFYSFQALIILSLIDQHDRLVKSIPVLNNNVVLLLAVFTGLLCISALAFYTVEEPARRWVKRRYSPERRSAN